MKNGACFIGSESSLFQNDVHCHALQIKMSSVARLRHLVHLAVHHLYAVTLGSRRLVPCPGKRTDEKKNRLIPQFDVSKRPKSTVLLENRSF